MGLGIDGQLLYDIGIAAMLHDIGKLFIPIEIINNRNLWIRRNGMMKQHPIRGAEYLLGCRISEIGSDYSFEHHMKSIMRLSGSPKGWKQNLCSQITTISDHFDAMRTRRSYRNALETEEVISFMSDRLGIELHPG